MAIQKRFIHFKKFSDFNSKKLSANEANTQYTVGVSGDIQDGEPDVLYQSYCWIKDTKQQWTHGQLYDGSVSQAHIDDSIMWVKAEGESGVRLKGTNGTATGNLAISAGDDKTASDGTLFSSAASGDHAVSFGYGNTCAGRTTLAQGLYNTVNGKDSAAFGQRNLVNGDQAFAAGQQNEVTARLGVAIGYQNKTTNTDSIAIGYKNTSSGSASVAMGDTCEASGTSSTAMGYKTKATGAYTSTFGTNTQATNEGEVAMGKYNKSTTSTEASEQTAFSFGIGTSDTKRSNAFEIKKNGDVYIGDNMLSDIVNARQEKLISGTNIKTFNGESILGSGDISISGGSGGVYITPFTVDDFCSGYVALTEEQVVELLEAASQKKIIGMRLDEDGIGYIVTDYLYFNSTENEYWYLSLGVTYNGSHYSNTLRKTSGNIFADYSFSVTNFIPGTTLIFAEDGVANVEDPSEGADNCIFLVNGECTELYVNLIPTVIGKTVRFFTGESCTLEISSTIYWANGEVPTIEPYTQYELSLVNNTEGGFNAVLTPFKTVE